MVGGEPPLSTDNFCDHIIGIVAIHDGWSFRHITQYQHYELTTMHIATLLLQTKQ